MTTAIVILNYNGRAYLEHYLPGVLAQATETTQIYVADNASTDDSVAWLRAQQPQVQLIELTENYGFAEGYNRALQQVRAEVYVLLNSDVEVTPHWLQPCLAVLAAQPAVAACQPRIRSVHQPDHFEYAGAAGGWIDALGYPFCRGRIFDHTEPDSGQYDNMTPIFWASGAALFVRAKLFHALGGFDGEYFAHAEEIDLCWRLKRAGYRVVAVPDSTVYHVGGGTLAYTSPRKTLLNFRNTLLTGLKNESTGRLFPWFVTRLLLDGVAAGLFLSQGKWAHIGAIVQAHWAILPRLGHWRRRRRYYTQLVEQARYGPSRVSEGRWPGSIVWSYYVRGRRTFRELVEQGR